VAALLELSEEAVRQRLSRARARLRAGLLERFGDLLGRTAPDARFSVAVLAALPTAAPGVLAGGLGVKAAKLGGAALGGAGLGLLGGLAGVLFSRRQGLQAARSEEERRGVRRYAWVGAGACVAFVVLLGLVARYQWPWPVLLAVDVGFLAVMGWTYGVALPRVIAPRLAAELQEDPVGAAKRHARQRLCSRWGLWGGMALSALAMAWSLWQYRA
jgi:hypothetical protein